MVSDDYAGQGSDNIDTVVLLLADTDGISTYHDWNQG